MWKQTARRAAAPDISASDLGCDHTWWRRAHVAFHRALIITTPQMFVRWRWQRLRVRFSAACECFYSSFYSVRSLHTHTHTHLWAAADILPVINNWTWGVIPFLDWGSGDIKRIISTSFGQNGPWSSWSSPSDSHCQSGLKCGVVQVKLQEAFEDIGQLLYTITLYVWWMETIVSLIPHSTVLPWLWH